MSRVVSLLVLGLFCLVLLNILSASPVQASSGTTTLFVTNNQTSISAGNFQDSSSSISIQGGSSLASYVDGATPTVTPAYFAVNLTGVSFSGAQFFLYLSRNGLSQISSNDIQFAGPFNVADLSTSPKLVGGYYIGKSGSTEYVSGRVSSGEAGGTYYIKVYDGSSTSISVSQQTVTILPSVQISPTSGPAGMPVVLTGYGFTPNGVVNITIQNSTSSPIKLLYTHNITASSAGNFTWSSSNSSLFVAPDLGKLFNGNPVVQPEGNLYYTAYDWTAKFRAVAPAYSEYYREFISIRSYDPATKTYLIPSGSSPWGNGTHIVAYTYQPFNVSGNFFNPASGLTFTFAGKPITPLYMKSENGTGYFVANFTTPDLTAGYYPFKVIDASGSMTVVVQVVPTSLVIPQVTMTLSYTITGGGSGYSPPIFTYYVNGSLHTVSLTATPTPYKVDQGTGWSITNPLTGSSANEVWKLNQPSSGSASSNVTISFNYYHQYLVTFSYGIGPSLTQLPPGGGPINPIITYVSFGVQVNTTVGNNVWADASSAYRYQNPISGSSAGERYSTQTPTGTISSYGLVQNTYYHQFQVYFGYIVNLGGSYTPPSIQYLYYNQNVTTSGNTEVWVDSGSYYSYPLTLAGSTSTERWYATGGVQISGTVSASQTLSVIYSHQYYLTMVNSVQAGGTISPLSGWYDANSIVQISATPSSGWQFGAWSGSGASSISGSLATTSLALSSPVTETATFNPGLTISASNGGSVLYSYGSVSGTVYSGQSRTLYVPLGTVVSVTAQPSSLLQSFRGWSGVSQSTAGSVQVTVQAPSTVSASFGTNYIAISIIVVVAALIIIVLIFVALRLRRPRSPV